MSVDISAGVGLVWATESVEPPDPNEGFITDIDQAMKDKVQGIYVNDREADADRRLMRAFFRWPQVEVTDQTFPFFTIDLLRYERAASREQRAERFPLPYAPKNYALPSDVDSDTGPWLLTEMPIPYDFTYQITAHARYNSHIREAMEQMVGNDRFAPRGAYLIVNDTVRYMEIDGPVDASGMDQEPGGRPKRHFRKVWTATVQTELFQSTIDQLGAANLLALTVASME
jgi:hypothetical protein